MIVATVFCTSHILTHHELNSLGFVYKQKCRLAHVGIHLIFVVVTIWHQKRHNAQPVNTLMAFDITKKPKRSPNEGINGLALQDHCYNLGICT